jgi:hypothetical protein
MVGTEMDQRWIRDGWMDECGGTGDGPRSAGSLRSNPSQQWGTCSLIGARDVIDGTFLPLTRRFYVEVPLQRGSAVTPDPSGHWLLPPASPSRDQHTRYPALYRYFVQYSSTYKQMERAPMAYSIAEASLRCK